MRRTVGNTFKLLSAIFIISIIAGAGCDPLDNTCSGPLHDHARVVKVTGLSDTMYVGDTILIEISMEWINDSTENGGTYDLRDLEDPTDHGLHMFSSNAPLGGRGDFPTDRGVRSFGNDDIIPLYGQWSVFAEQASVLGDSTTTRWRAAVQLVFNRPGRNYVTFTNLRTNDNYGQNDDVVYANGITTDGCDERIVTRQILQGYSYNEDMITNAERFSDVKITNGVWGLQEKYAAFYVLVFE